MKNELKVKAIEHGTVIDHIQSEKLFKVLSIIDVDKMDTEIFIGNNLDSKKYGSKGIIKISNKFPTIEDANKIALIDPNAVINIIRDFKVVEKRQVELPQKVRKFVKCINPKCITNVEDVETSFDLAIKDGEIKLKCKYCEKTTSQRNIQIIE